VQSFKPRGFKVCCPYFVGCKTSSFFHFKCHNPTNYAVNFFEKNSTNYSDSPKQDPTVESQKNKEFIHQFVQFALEMAVL
jgi:hypothetical protein